VTEVAPFGKILEKPTNYTNFHELVLFFCHREHGGHRELQVSGHLFFILKGGNFQGVIPDLFSQPLSPSLLMEAIRLQHQFPLVRNLYIFIRPMVV
jgi:hypothetical protein